MKLLRDGIDRVPDGIATAVSIGAYDGIHRGHQTVLNALCEHAATRGLEPAVVTFDQHPASVVRPDAAPLLLTDDDQREELFAELGLRWLYLLRFDKQRAATTSEQFVEQVLLGSLNAKLIVVGSDFHFGQGRAGTVESLAEMGASLGFEVLGLDLLGAGGDPEPISSTAIRAALVRGDIAAANGMLGRRYQVRGEVVRGDERARQIGFPTANVASVPGQAWPMNGVYSAWVQVPDGRQYPAAVNIGTRPTFHSDATRPLLEAHLIGFDGDLYGQSIHVEFETFLRDERTFAGLEEITAQITSDVAAARDVLTSSPGTQGD